MVEPVLIVALVLDVALHRTEADVDAELHARRPAHRLGERLAEPDDAAGDVPQPAATARARASPAARSPAIPPRPTVGGRGVDRVELTPGQPAVRKRFGTGAHSGCAGPDDPVNTTKSLLPRSRRARVPPRLGADRRVLGGRAAHGTRPPPPRSAGGRSGRGAAGGQRELSPLVAGARGVHVAASRRRSGSVTRSSPI